MKKILIGIILFAALLLLALFAVCVYFINYAIVRPDYDKTKDYAKNAKMIYESADGPLSEQMAVIESDDGLTLSARVIKALEGFLRPEFINRVDDIIVFNRLTKTDCEKIAEIMLGDLAGVLADKNIELNYDASALSAIAETGFSEKYGARNLRRLIQTDIEDKIALKIIETYQNPIKKVTVKGGEDGSLSVSFE